MVYLHWLSLGLRQRPGLGHGRMVLCRTFHTAPEQEQESEQRWKDWDT